MHTNLRQLLQQEQQTMTTRANFQKNNPRKRKQHKNFYEDKSTFNCRFHHAPKRFHLPRKQQKHTKLKCWPKMIIERQKRQITDL